VKQTKWATHQFSATERKARAKWRRAQEQRSGLIAGLMTCDYYADRKELHRLLDKRLDTIEKTQASAKTLFPEVDESFIIATSKLTL